MKKKRFLNIILVLALMLNLILPTGFTAYAASDGNFQYTLDDDGATITGYTGPAGVVVIPNTLGGEPVTAIGYRAFALKGLTEVTIPSSVVSISVEAFDGDDISEVILPAGLTVIEPGIFRHNNLKSIVISDNITSIGNQAFYDNKLESVTIGSSVRSLGQLVFSGNKLEKVTIPNSLESIVNSMFTHNGPSSNSGDILGTAEEMRGTWYCPGTVWSKTLPDISMALSPGASVLTTKATMSESATDRWFILIDNSGIDKLVGTVLPTEAVLYESGDDIYNISLKYIHVYDVDADNNVVGSHTEQIHYADINFTNAFAGGDGTTENPYQIETADQLSNINLFNLTRDDGIPNNFILNNDIDLNIAPYNSGEGWTPCILDGGDFDGNGKTISNLMINRPEQDVVGLFGSIVRCTVKNLAITNASVVGRKMTGILAGLVYDVHIEQVSVTGSVKGTNGVGGIVGFENISFGTILNCYSTATVTGENAVGGLVGAIDASSIKTSYAAGIVTATSTMGGGIVGGENASVFESAYYDSQVTTQADDTGKGSPTSTEEMKMQSTFVGFDFDTVWTIDPIVNGGYPYFMSRMILNQDQAAPTGLAGVAPTFALNDGKITGTTTAMEFKMEFTDDSTYSTCWAEETTVATPATYVVRLKAKSGYNAGATASVTVPAYAAGAGSAIQFGAGGIAEGDHVYYGTDSVYYRVLSATGNGGTYVNDSDAAVSNPMLLISEYLLDSVQFDSTEGSNVWNGSTAQSWCNSFATTNNFSAKELASILKTTKSDEQYLSMPHWRLFSQSTDTLNGVKVFFLSAQEVQTYFTSDSARIAMVGSSTGSVGSWWLRSPSTPFEDRTGVVDFVGEVVLGDVSMENLVRPAFNLNPNAVLFSSAATGGKSSGTVGATALNLVSTPSTPNDWKLTLLDGARSFEVANSTAQTVAQGADVSVTYTGATVGANEYVSSMIVDTNNEVVYYGRIADKSTGDADATADITIPAGLATGNYTLKVFSEQYNGDNIADYASAFKDISLTVTVAPSFVGVTGITNVPTTGTVGTEMDLTGATVAPTDPTNQEIAWTVTSAGTTGVTTAEIVTGKFTPSAAGTLELKATITNGATSSTDYTQTFAIVVSALHVTTYALTVNLNGGNGTTTDGNFAEGATITINAGTRSGYNFKGWTSSNGGSFANANSTSTSFTMPANATTIIASWSYNGGSTASNTDTNTNMDQNTKMNPNTNINVGGENINAGNTTTTEKDGKSTTTVKVDDQKIEEKLATASDHVVITIPVNTGSDRIVGELNGQLVKSMEMKQATIEIKTETATYTLPAQQINIDAVSEQIGKNVELKDIIVTIEIVKPTQETVTIVENAAKAGEFTLIAPPVEFNISCTYGDKTVNVSQFNNYVERTIALPAGVDASKITTAVIIDADGTVRHVPTKIIIIDGKYYAKINSLTNSTYSVIWHPVVFKDVEQHWAKGAIDDMGSRMVISGVENHTFEPDRDITRAEFATIMVSALGLEPGMGDNQFKDVNNRDWYCDYIKTAYEYKLISGYDADTFAPNDKITREQAMTMIARAMNITGLEVELTAEEIATVLSDFIDADKSEIYAKEGMVSCIKAGITTGRTANQIAPKDNITRAEVAVMVQKLLQKSDLI